MLDTKNWTVFNHLFIWGSVASFYIIQITCSLPHLAGTFIYDWFGTSGSLFKVAASTFSYPVHFCLFLDCTIDAKDYERKRLKNLLNNLNKFHSS